MFDHETINRYHMNCDGTIFLNGNEKIIPYFEGNILVTDDIKFVINLTYGTISFEINEELFDIAHTFPIIDKNTQKYEIQIECNDKNVDMCFTNYEVAKHKSWECEYCEHANDILQQSCLSCNKSRLLNPYSCNK